MKKSISRKIEQLLASMTGSASPNEKNENRAFRSESGETGLARQIGDFCRQVPVHIIRFMRPDQKLDLQ